jgi:hypothetical protein
MQHEGILQLDYVTFGLSIGNRLGTNVGTYKMHNVQ